MRIIKVAAAILLSVPCIVWDFIIVLLDTNTDPSNTINQLLFPKIWDWALAR